MSDVRLSAAPISLIEHECVLQFSRDPAHVKNAITVVTALKINASNPHPVGEKEVCRCRIPMKADPMIFPHWTKPLPPITKGTELPKGLIAHVSMVPE